MRAKGYKCSNVKCGSCVSHSLCGEPADTALGCVNRMVSTMTNADQIRAMSDEELAQLLVDGCRGSKCEEQPQNEFGSVNCFDCRMKWLKQPADQHTSEDCE